MQVCKLFIRFIIVLINYNFSYTMNCNIMVYIPEERGILLLENFT